LRPREKRGSDLILAQSGASARARSGAIAAFALSLCIAAAARAEPTSSGQTGYINMPSARIEPDGTWTAGYSVASPYAAFYNNVAIFPFAEINLSAIRVIGERAFPDQPGNREQYKDERADVKLRLFDEEGNRPAVAIGAQDFFGTRLFASEYVVASRQLGLLDLSLGYGWRRLTALGAGNTGVNRRRNRIDGAFAGARLRLGKDSPWSLVAERDGYDYARDTFVSATHVDERKGGLNIAAEYRWNWLGVQLSRQGKEPGLNLSVRLPLERRQFVPKIDEPPPYTRLRPRPLLAEWNARHEDELARALFAQGFEDVSIRLDDRAVLHVAVSHPRISRTARAVGRAVRTALLLSPAQTREIRITPTEHGMPVARYEFVDLAALQRYFNGQLPRRELAQSVSIDAAAPGAFPDAGEERQAVIAEMEAERERPFEIATGEDGHLVSLRSESARGERFSLVPLRISTLTKSATGYYQYQIFATADYERNLGSGYYLGAGMSLRLHDNFRPDIAPSDSRINIVRSDAHEYLRASRLKLSRLIVNRFGTPARGLYTRWSAGFYEDMYAGVGGQALIVPRRGAWAFDVAVDALKRRGYDSRLSFQSYSTVTAIASAHYRLAKGYELAIRGGRFLARDVGARFEFKRRFASGVEAGAWISATNNEDFNAPGSQGKRYRDKGVFLSVPFEIMLTKDTRAQAGFAFQEWGRDVAQMVASPADLYAMMEGPRRSVLEADGLSGLGDVEDDDALPDLGSSVLDRSWLDIAGRDAASAGSLFGDADTWKAIGLGTAATLLSAGLDAPGWRFARSHGRNGAVRALRAAGDAVPFVALAAAGVAAMAGQDRRLANTGIAALEAGLAGLLTDQAAEYAIGRSRPTDGRGRTDFHPFAAGNLRSSLPSTHTSLAWAFVTPFAREYELPWLYGVAALANFARVSAGKHWFSDTVAGAAVGYGAGTMFWQWRRKPDDTVQIGIGPAGLQARIPLR